MVSKEIELDKDEEEHSTDLKTESNELISAVNRMNLKDTDKELVFFRIHLYIVIEFNFQALMVNKQNLIATI